MTAYSVSLAMAAYSVIVLALCYVMLSEVEASPRHGWLYVILSETKDLKVYTIVHRHGDLEILHCVQNDKV